MRMQRETAIPRARIRTLLAATLAAGLAAGATVARALPTDPVVVNGTASVSQTGNVLTVTNSHGAIIDWQSFGIAAGETAHFLQSSASSAVLNRVLSNNPSEIYGTLSSNGQVWLINPAGILVGAGAVVDTAGFVASTLAVRAEDFLAGRLDFQATPGAGDVVNRGSITTPLGGFVYLVGANVANEGLIATPGGETLLAAGTTVSLIDTATPGVKVEITGDANNATNLGEIVATAGRIGIAGGLVRNAGTLDASSVVSAGGRIFLKASQDTHVEGDARILATGATGGAVEVLGNRVAVTDNALIDVSGTNGGGTIKVGGDYQGQNPDIQNAWVTYFGPQATLKANATEVGAGGTVIVWADDITRAHGTIEAQGSVGAGGFVETSGKRYLDVNGIRVATAGGTWLLDPTDITVVSSSAAIGLNNSGGIFSGTAAAATIGWDTINGALSSGNVVIHTSSGFGGTNNGTITFSGSGISAGGNHSLSFLAENNIAVNADITFTSSGNLTMVAGWNSASGYTNPTATHATNAGNLDIDADITLNNNGVLKLLAKGNIYQDPGMTLSGNTLDAKATGTISLTGDNLMNNVSLNSASAGTPAIDYRTDNAMTHLVLVEAPNGGVTVQTVGNANASNQDIGIKTINAGGTVSITAQNVIADDNGYGIAAPNITLISTRGIHSSTPSWGLAVSADVELTSAGGTLIADVANAGGGGGIRVWNDGYAPTTLFMRDYSGSGKEAHYWQQDSSLAVSNTFTLHNPNGEISVGTSGNLAVNNAANISTNTASLMFYAGGNLTVSAALNTTGTGTDDPGIYLGAGGTLDINANLTSSGDIGVIAGIAYNTWDKLNDMPTPEEASQTPLSAGGQLNVSSALVATGKVGMLAPVIDISEDGSVQSGDKLYAYTSTDMTLTNGAFMEADLGVYLAFGGGSSTLYLNETSGHAPAYILGNTDGTESVAVRLDFLARSSGGVVMDGFETFASTANGSGFFNTSHGTPAVLGSTLLVTYGLADAITAAVTNEVANSTEPTSTTESALPLTTTGDDLAAAPTEETTGGGTDEFGGTAGEEDGEGDEGQADDGTQQESDKDAAATKKAVQCRG
jgi:filamentous hemagglutinin family protein